VLSIASACERSARAASVGNNPVCERVNNGKPSACSNTAMCLPIVGCATPSARAAPDSEPSRSTPKKDRYSSQLMSSAMQKCIAAPPSSAI
jgi:hypothetical protein